MNDIIIPHKRVKREIWTLVSCFVIANLINLYAIITFKTKFTELFTMIGYVVVTSLALYFVWSLLRSAFYLIKLLITFIFKKHN
jgi:uncharacterized membrane protein